VRVGERDEIKSKAATAFYNNSKNRQVNDKGNDFESFLRISERLCAMPRRTK
jgi:hypothetical protein